MANIKLKNNYWVTESIYDTTDSKTQKQVNADLHQDISDLNGAISENEILYYNNLQMQLTSDATGVFLRIPETGLIDDITPNSIVINMYFNRPDGIKSTVTWESFNGYIEFKGYNVAFTNATANVTIGKKKIV